MLIVVVSVHQAVAANSSKQFKELLLNNNQFRECIMLG
jgi:hypothetical protein